MTQLDARGEPLTEGIVDTQMAEHPLYAWSEDTGQWPTPTGRYRPQRNWRRPVGRLIRYGLPALMVAVAAILMYLSDHRVHQAATPPTTPAAPPAVVVPPPAPPTTPPSAEDGFIAALINHDASLTQPSVAIKNAHQVCIELGQGRPRPDIAESVKAATDGYTETRAAIFVALSANYYCPQYGTS